MDLLGGGAFSYESGTPVCHKTRTTLKKNIVDANLDWIAGLKYSFMPKVKPDNRPSYLVTLSSKPLTPNP